LSLIAESVSPLALLIHEFTTNATKYGALSTPDGRIDIRCFEDGEQFVLTWIERGGPPLDGSVGEDGFGSLLTRATAERQLKGFINREWAGEGLTIRLSIPRERLAGRLIP